MQAQPYRILIIAGEASGDVHGGALVKEFRARYPGVVFEGVGGRHMKSAGVKLDQDIDGLGAMGISEFFGSLLDHIRLFRNLSRKINNGFYHAAILINYPGFNLRLAKVLKKANCPVLFFIGPQIWASRPGRITSIQKTVRKMYVVFPFEQALYEKAGVDVAYHGHPFVDLVQPALSPEQVKKEFDLEEGVPTIGLLPGSRMSEINLILDAMLSAAKIIRKELGNCRFLLPVADTLNPEVIEKRIGENALGIRLVTGKNYDVMSACDYLITTSGSATLEASILEKPMVIMYRVQFITYLVFSYLIKIHVRFMGIPNLIADKAIVPELLQKEVNGPMIAEKALAVLKDPEQLESVKAQLAGVHAQLGESGVLGRVADDMAQTLGITNSSQHEKASL